jgi:hypothetical protein
MKFHRIVLPLLVFASAALADDVPLYAPPSIATGNLFKADTDRQHTLDSGIAAASVSTIGLTSHGDSNYALASTDRVVQLSAPLTTTRTWTLACASSVSAGQAVQIIDPSTNLVPTPDVSAQYYPLIIAPKSSGCSDTLNGSASNTAHLASPGARAAAISDGASNWSVTVVRQPERTLDFARDFGGVPAVAIGTTDCTLATDGSNTVTCPDTDLSSLQVNDQFEAQAAKADGTTLTTYVTGVTLAFNRFTIHDAPHFDTSVTKVIDALFVCNPGDLAECNTPSTGYSFGSTQTLPKGVGTDISATATPKLMTVHSVQMHSGGGGSGCTASGSSLTLVLAPAGYPTALSGIQATFSGTISGGSLTSINPTPLTGALYRRIGSYSYDSGWYRNIPVAPPGTCITPPTVDIQFGIVTEVITRDPNVYASTSIPCNDKTDGDGNAAPVIDSTDAGNGLWLKCSSHTPLVSFGHDNIAAIEAVNKYESDQNKAHSPVCVNFSGRFLSSAIDLGVAPNTHLIKGAPCLKGDAQVLSGIFIFPNQSKTGDLVIFPIVDANHKGASPEQGMGGYLHHRSFLLGR